MLVVHVSLNLDRLVVLATHLKDGLNLRKPLKTKGLVKVEVTTGTRKAAVTQA